MPDPFMDFDSRDREAIRAWGQSLEHDVSVVLLTSIDARSLQLGRFCEYLTSLVPRCHFDRKNASESAPPCITVGTRQWVYAVPTGGELEPFLAMLAEGTLERPEQALAPAEPKYRLRIYVAPTCPHCPRVLGTLVSHLAACPEFSLEVVDATLFGDLADQDRISSVPTLILNRRLRMIGALEPRDVREFVGPVGKYSSRLFSRLLEAGNLDSLAHALHEDCEAPPALADLLSDSTFSVRLAAMTLVEKLADMDHRLAERLAEPLWERFGSSIDSIRGDLLYMIGRVGTLHDVPRLQEIVGSAAVDDVLDAAQEAIEGLTRTE